MAKSSKRSGSKYVSQGRLELIEQQLLAIGGAQFQALCDVYLVRREQELASINRTGSQLGKQKTVKGTPDTFYRLSDGRLGYVEYTTQKNKLVAKIKEDIDKCLDSKKTGVPAKQVYKIIICYNSRLNPAQETSITEYAVSKRVQIELIGLDWLALEIYSKYLILARDFLGIPLDTGQLLPLQNFIEEYNNKAGKLSTPLDNSFMHRKDELADIESALNTSDILIVSGFPGVGKTKIALEALDKFLTANHDYSALAVSKKDQDISEDLKIHLQQEKNYVLLVDDANRQLPNFQQILGVFRENRKGNIKLIVTVRDYALNDVEKECDQFEPNKITLPKFSDKEITDLISSDSFEIRNSKYQKKIVEVADGNARLAVMAARLAKEKQELFLLGDVSDLYDSYFQTFIRDFDLFADKTLLKTLGIISFFYTIDRSNKKFIETVLTCFEVDYHAFNEAINELERRELVEVQYNNARVSEQVMATYFFHKVFIKDHILSFKSLLVTFYPSWKKRFSDTIIPSNNSFGYEGVLNSISQDLDEYLESIYAEDEKVLEFFSFFWFYKREEAIGYYYEKIEQLPEPENPTYHTKYETNDFTWNTDKTLDFLTKFFPQFTESYLSAIELAFEYCRKKPVALPELIKRIGERLLFSEDDYRYDFKRQTMFFNLLIDKFKENQLHYVKAFFALAETFLSHHYNIVQGGRNFTMSFYDYPLPLNKATKAFRKVVWHTLFEGFATYPSEAFSTLKNYSPGNRGAIQVIHEYDLLFLLPFIQNNLNPKDFEHIHFVHDFVAMLDRQKTLSDKSYQKLKLKFKSKEYDYFKKLDWNRIRGKQDYEFENHEDFKRLKEQDIRKSFVFKKKSEFKPLIKVINKILLLDERAVWSVQSSVDVILEENFLQNSELGFQFLEYLLAYYPKGLNPPYNPINKIVAKSKKWALRFWNLIDSWKHENKLYWKLTFWGCLPQEYVSKFYFKKFFETINSINIGCYLHFESFEKFVQFDRNTIRKILQITASKIENENLRIQLPYHFFEKYTPMHTGDFKLLAQAYIQQERVIDLFDYERLGLKALLQVNEKFLVEYITVMYGNKETLHNRKTDKNLSFVWDLKGCNELVEKCANIIIDHTTYFGISKHPLIIFFHKLSEEQKIKAKQFILHYIKKYNSDTDKMNPVFDVLRHVVKDFFEEAFLCYLSYNTSVKSFKKIWWRGNGGTYSGEVNIGEIQAKEWQNILTMANNAKNQLGLIPIKTYLKREIGYDLQRADGERKRKFIDPDRY